VTELSNRWELMPCCVRDGTSFALQLFVFNGRFIRCVCFSGRELLKLTDKSNVYRLTTLTET
jgi:hypothetical protein